jgi:hypothetical protein
MARDTPWLREECGLILYEAVPSLAQRTEGKESVEEIVYRLSSFQLVNTPEGVAIWLAVRSTFPKIILPAEVWHDNDPLAKKNRSKLAKVLKEDFGSASKNGNGELIKNAAANPNPIFAWDVVLSEMLQRESKGDHEKKSSRKTDFAQFWIDIVDSNLFSASASHERKLWGFKILSNMVRSAPHWALLCLFSPSLMRSLINQSKKEDRFLHAAALASFKAIQARVQDEPSSAAPIFIALTSEHGAIDLDKLTKTKTLETILSLADDDALRKVVDHLRSLIVRPRSQERNIADHQRRVIADMLLHIVKGYKKYENNYEAISQDSSWLHTLLDTIVEHAYFMPGQSAKADKVPLPSISEHSRKVYQERLSSCLGRLLAVEKDTSVSFPFLVVKMIKSKTASQDLQLVFRADDSVMKIVRKANKSLESLSAKVCSSCRC